MKTKFILLSLISIVFGFMACSKSLHKKLKHPLKGFHAPPSYVYIPSGPLKTRLGDLNLKGVFMSESEVSNNYYNQFLADLKKQGKTAEYNIAKRQPEKWHIEDFQKKYHTDPTYGYYKNKIL